MFKRKTIAKALGLNNSKYQLKLSLENRYTVISFENIKSSSVLEDSEFALTVKSLVSKYFTLHNLDINKKGMRFVLDIDNNANIKLYFGHDRIAPQNAVDFHKAMKDKKWQPVTDNKGPFFSAVDQAAFRRDSVVGPAKFGDNLVDLKNELIYLDSDSNIYAVADGNPCAQNHFLLLTSDFHATYLDQDVTDKDWEDLFKLAYHIVEQRSEGQPKHIRIISNIGQKLQVAPVAHFHVVIDDELPSIMPEDYGFEVGNDNAIILTDEQRELFIKELAEPYGPNGLIGSSQRGLHQKLSEFLKDIN